MSKKNKIQSVNSITLNGANVVTLLVDGMAFYREYNDTVSSATCQNEGYTTHTAKDGKSTSFPCPDGSTMPYTYKDNYTSKRSHLYNYDRGYKNNKEPTCQREGIHVWECQWCTAQIESTEGPVAHNYIYGEVNYEEQYNRDNAGDMYRYVGYRCSVCKQFLKEVRYQRWGGGDRVDDLPTKHKHTYCKWCKKLQ